MNKELILPAAFALTVHAFVLFGLNGRRPLIIAPPGKGIPVKVDKTLEVELDDPVIPIGEDESGGATTTGKNAVSRLPDIPVVNPPPGVPTVPVIPAIPGNPDATTIPVDWQEGWSPKKPGTDVFDSRFLDRVPRARLQPAPVYPFELRKNRVEGTVLVEFLVDEAGDVYHAAVVSATTPGFEDAALRAVARWKFEPGRRSGRLVRFRMSVPVVFRITDD